MQEAAHTQESYEARRAISSSARQPDVSTSAKGPTITVVIPAYNCADTISMCLESIFAQTYPRDRFEVILVDDGSTDGTAPVAQTCAATQHEYLSILSQANGGPASARNAGIRMARGSIVAFIDADCIASPDWLTSLARAFDQHPDVAGIGGPLHNAVQSETMIARYLVAANFYRHREHRGKVDYLLTANAAFLRSALNQVGGFTERKRAWAEDADLSFRLTQSGHRLLLIPEGFVTHFGVLESLRDFVRGLYNYGFGNAVLAKEWPAQRGPGRQLVRHLGAAVLAPWLAWRLRKRVGWRSASMFCPVIVLEHLTYSVGLIRGVIASI